MKANQNVYEARNIFLYSEKISYNIYDDEIGKFDPSKSSYGVGVNTDMVFANAYDRNSNTVWKTSTVGGKIVYDFKVC